MIIKTDFLLKNEKNYSNIIIIKNSAVAVIILYIIFGAIYYHFYNHVGGNFVIFLLLSIFSVVSNVFLMQRILCVEQKSDAPKALP